MDGINALGALFGERRRAIVLLIVPVVAILSLIQASEEALRIELAAHEARAEVSQAASLYLPVVVRSEADAPPESGIRRLRPYTSTSVWNTPIGANPRYDPNSEEMIATIGLDADGEISSDPSQYSFPVYFVDSSTPRWDVRCLEYNCTVVTPQGNSSTPVLQDVPIPAEARPSEGSDAQMIIIDEETGTEYDLWRVSRSGSGWTASNGSVYNVFWDGMPPRYGSRGAGVPYYAGLIRPWEIRRGKIEHAIAFAYPETAEERCTFPATKTDGESSLPYAIPEGARLQLDPGLTEADFTAMGLSETGKIIARALQEYGMILVDTSGRAKIYAEDLANNPYAGESWSDPGLNLHAGTIARIPYTAFRVLALPEAYWGSGPSGGMHGECYR